MTIKLSSRYRSVIFALIMSLNTALIVSGVITFINTPSTRIFLDKWPSNFLLGWPLVFLSKIFISPLINRFVNLIVD